MQLADLDEPLALLATMLADAERGHGRTALVEGGAALGKSALLDAFADQATGQGALVLVASATESENHIPLGVMSQLLEEAPLVAEERRRTDALFSSAADHGPEPSAPVSVQALRSLYSVLLTLAEKQPLVIVVDDAHHADPPSLACLSYLTRRIRTARVMACFSHSEQAAHRHTAFRLDLLRRPGNCTLRILPLTRAGVTKAVAARLGGETAHRIAAGCLAVTGGNPHLLEGLLADQPATAASFDAAVADGYGKAVVSLLHRSGSRTLSVAQGLAVLRSADGVDRLLGLDGDSVAEALDDLTVTGLLSAGEFRHPAARAAVLKDIGPRRRGELHAAAAELTYLSGAPAVVVAEHLTLARSADAPWMVPVLEQGAAQAVAEGSVERAVDYLKLACTTCSDERRIAQLRTSLVRAEWRIDPRVAAPHLGSLLAAHREGLLRPDDAVVLIKALLWHGKFDDARDVLVALGASPALQGPGLAAQVQAIRLWLRCTYTPLLEHVPKPAPEAGGRALEPPAAAHRIEAVGALEAVLSGEPAERVLTQTERVLRRTRMDETDMDSMESALLALVYGEHPDRAELWCETLVEEAVARHSPSREARLRSIWTEISFRQGDLAEAERQARLALNIIPAGGWGARVGTMLAGLVTGLTAMGSYEDAGRQLAVPVPDIMWQSRYGLQYLQARGRHHLAMGNPDAALSDFRSCGDHIVQWGLDAPGFIAWRNDCAEALVDTGDLDAARKLLQEQLSRCGTTAQRTHGVAMRILSSTLPVQRRPEALHRSVELLEGSGDRYELARTLTDLTRTHRDLGELRLARLIGRRAWDLAQRCQARPLASVLGAALGQHVWGLEADPAPAGSETVISRAEQRVIELAARGYTNREIGRRLYVTVSTVEQHLTNVYRRLKVTRAELPSVLADLAG
ncbi:AAA family ATPase [Streptomyces phaeolivaceus]|nr:LuxR family transcriptional regulator [Streptomyces phaeolivaceus]